MPLPVDYVAVRTGFTPALAGALRSCVLEQPFREPVEGREAEFVKLCQVEGLLGGLVHQLERHGHPNQRLVHAARELYKEEFYGWARYQTWLDELHPVVERAGVEVLLLKGAALRLTVSSAPGLRRMSDVDLFVPAGSQRALCDALRAHGLYGDRNEKCWTDGTGRSLDLHVGTAGVLEKIWGFTQAALWRDSAPLAAYPAFRVLNLPQQLSYVAVHALKHSFHRLMWLTDVHRLYQAAGNPSASRPVRASLYLLEQALGQQVEGSLQHVSWLERRILRSLLQRDQRPLGQLLLSAYLPDWGSRWRYLREVARDRDAPISAWGLRLAWKTCLGLSRR